MRIWYRRPLFCFCAVFMAAAGGAWLLFSDAPAPRRVLAAAAALISALLLLAALLLRAPSRSAVRRVLLRLGLLTVSAALALSVSALYFGSAAAVRELALSPDAPVGGSPFLPGEGSGNDPISGDDGSSEDRLVTVEGVITASLTAGRISTYEVTLRALNGHPVGSPLAPFRARLTCYYTSDLRPGNVIRMTAACTFPEDEAASREEEVRLLSDGITLCLHSYDESDWVITDNSDSSLSTRLLLRRESLAARLDVLGGRGAYGLPAALLLGVRSSLFPTLRRDFSRAGASHMLAISGLHVTLLFTLLTGLLTLLRVPKSLRSLLALLLGVGYLFLLGFPPSAVRAVIMLGMLCLGDLFSASSDGLTSLGLAGALILSLNPAAVCDIGFWMSFSATLGLLTLLPVLKPTRRIRSLTRPLTALLAGVCAVTFSLWITALSTGRVSLFSPLASLLLTPMCAVLLLLSLLLLPLGGTWMGTAVLSPLLRLICRGMAGLCGLLGAPTWAVLPLTHPAVLPVAVCMILVTLLLLSLPLSRRAGKSILLPTVCGWLVIALLLGGSSFAARRELTVTYLHPTAAGDELILRRGVGAVIVDVSDGSASALRAAAGEAEADGAVELTALILTHYHTRHVGAVSRLASGNTLRALFLPLPRDENDYWLMRSLLDAASDAGIPVRLYTPGDPADAGRDGEDLIISGVRLRIGRGYIGRSTQPLVTLSLSCGEQRVTYLGGAVLESRFYEAAEALLRDSDALFLGSHGPKMKEAHMLTDLPRAAIVTFADEKAQAGYSLPPDLPVTVGRGRFTLRLPDRAPAGT